MPGLTDVFAGLGQGYLERKQAVEREEFDREQKSKDFAIQALFKIADEVTPETRPMLYQQIANIAGMKGKAKGFWERLSSIPDRSLSEQVSGSMQDFLGRVVGPEEYERRKPGIEATTERMPIGGPGMPESIGMPRITQLPDRTKGIVALRDPVGEQVRAFTGKETLRLQSKMQEIEKKEQEVGKRQQALELTERESQLQLARERAMLKAQEAMRMRAWVKGRGTIPTQEMWEEAADEIAEELGMKREEMRAKIDVMRAKTADLEASARTREKIAGMGGIRPGEAERLELSKRTFDEKQKQDAIAARRLYDNADADVKRFDAEIKSKEASLLGRIDEIVKFRARKGQPPIDPGIFKLNPEFQALQDQIDSIKAKREGAVSKRTAAAQDLGTKFGQYYNVTPAEGGGYKIDPIAEFGGVAPAGAPRVPPSPGLRPPRRETTTPTPPRIKSGETPTANMEADRAAAGPGAILARGSAEQPASNQKLNAIKIIRGLPHYVAKIVETPTPEAPYGYIIVLPLKIKR